MNQDSEQEDQERRDFLISYSDSDKQWAEWIAMQLEEAGYTLFIKAWDSRPGANFVAEMDQATKNTQRTLLVLSSAYLRSDPAFAEWAVAFRNDPKGIGRRLLPVRIEPCDIQGLLGSIGVIDLVSLDETQASDCLLAGVQQGRAKPATATFPGQKVPHAHATFPGSFPPTWNIPFPRNPFFTGREELLHTLTELLQKGSSAVLSQPRTQAISGLGGIGKTQLAVEYAYRTASTYQAVFWIAAETQETLIAGFAGLALALQLPEKDEPNQSRMIQAVWRWLQTNTAWLLILDNADDLALLSPFLPPSYGGRVLLTTRAQITGRFAQRLELSMLPNEEGALLLLRRAGLLTEQGEATEATAEMLALARKISTALGDLPLALDQAGAYIEETQSSLPNYWQQYQQRGKALLARRGQLVVDHPDPVATTWSLSFEKVEKINPIAGQVLRFCAFLAPDAIPEELVVQALNSGLLSKTQTPGEERSFPPAEQEQQEESIHQIEETWELDDSIVTLRAYSLIQRNPQEAVITVHRLVQTVLREAMTKEKRQEWVERTVHVIAEALPVTSFESWKQCELYIPHAQECVQMATERSAVEKAQVLYWIGAYLLERQRTQEAGPYVQQALTIREQQLGSEHPETAASLIGVARWWELQGMYKDAEPLFKRALAIREQQLGDMHPDTATSLNNLAGLYKSQGKFEPAEPLYVRALAIREQQLGDMHPDTATSLDNLAVLYRRQGKFEPAEPLYVRALAIREQQLGDMHPDTATSLDNLAGLYKSQGKFEQAQPLYVRALAIKEQQLGAMHPSTATSLNNLAALYKSQGKFEPAEPLYVRVLAISEQQLGAMHPSTATSLNNLAALYKSQGNYEQAQPLYVRALAIREQQLGDMHPSTASSLNNLAALYESQGNFQEAEPLFKRALMLRERALGPDHPDTAQSLWWLAVVSQQKRHFQEAVVLYQRALSIYERTLGLEHPRTQSIQRMYTALLKDMKRDEGAE